ncbi:MAG TPA: 50S ribosomal protein L1 [Candidatus Angelobacter sp.]|jgi:large subunit ribosomal protein L1|nr:50S ribosomal protein L1 [Candidatus Angelobacter sp.]
MPHTYGKKYREAAQQIDADRLYPPDEAVIIARQSSTAAFDATVEAHVRLGVDPRHADQMVRSSVLLPHGTGKVRRIAVFATGEKAKEALDAGADVVGGEDLVKKVQAGDIDFEVALATPDVMGMVGRLGKVLGPRGLMPNPKSGTVTFDIGKAVRDVQGGRVEFRVDRFGIVHVPVGKVSFDDDKLRENFAALMEAIVRAKPPAAKGTYVRTVTLAPTMGPGVHVDPAAAARLSQS